MLLTFEGKSSGSDSEAMHSRGLSISPAAFSMFQKRKDLRKCILTAVGDCSYGLAFLTLCTSNEAGAGCCTLF